MNASASVSQANLINANRRLCAGLFAGLFILALGCHASKATRYSGKWQQVDAPHNRLTIAKEGDAYICEIDWPYGSASGKYPATIRDGQLKVSGPMGEMGVAHIESSDHLVFQGGEYERSPVEEYRVSMAHMRLIAIAIEKYAEKNNDYPGSDNAEEVWKMLTPNYLQAGTPDDARFDGWGRPLRIDTRDRRYQIVSAGSDGVFDESSWSVEGLRKTAAEDIVYKNGRFTGFWELAPR